MVSQLESHLGRRGLGMIAPEVGRGLLIEELRYGRKGDVEVIYTGELGTLEQPIVCRGGARTGGGGFMSRGRPLQIAIVGMGCHFPGAARPDYLLGKHPRGQGLHCGRCRPIGGIRGSSAIRLSSANDRVPCSRGGYLDSPLQFDAAVHGIMPRTVEGGEPEQFLVLEAAMAALADAGQSISDLADKRVEVVIGRGNYFNRGNLTRLQHGRMIAQTLALLAAFHPEWSQADLEAIRDDLRKSLPPFEAATIPGQLTNATAGRLAHRLEFERSQLRR